MSKANWSGNPVMPRDSMRPLTDQAKRSQKTSRVHPMNTKPARPAPITS